MKTIINPAHPLLFTKCFLWVFVLFSANLSAQDRSVTEVKKERHGLTLNFAYTFIRKGVNEDNLNEKGHFVPGLGLDYFYRLHPKWEVGLMVDFELGKYLIPHKENLKRENAFVVALAGAHSLAPRWNIFLGIGAELEENKNQLVFRIGTDHAVPLKNKWFIPIGLFFDLKEGYDAWSLSVGIGKKI